MLLNLWNDRVVIDVATFKEVEHLLYEGLQTDGDHHKQWYLHQIAQKLSIDLDVIDVEPGIPD